MQVQPNPYCAQRGTISSLQEYTSFYLDCPDNKTKKQPNDSSDDDWGIENSQMQDFDD